MLLRAAGAAYTPDHPFRAVLEKKCGCAASATPLRLFSSSASLRELFPPCLHCAQFERILAPLAKQGLAKKCLLVRRALNGSRRGAEEAKRSRGCSAGGEAACNSPVSAKRKAKGREPAARPEPSASPLSSLRLCVNYSALAVTAAPAQTHSWFSGWGPPARAHPASGVWDSGPSCPSPHRATIRARSRADRAWSGAVCRPGRSA